MSTTIGGDLPTGRQAPPPNGITAPRKRRKRRANAKAKTAAPAPATTTSTTTRAAPRKAGAKTPRLAQAVRTAPIGISTTETTTGLIPAFLQSMPSPGTVLSIDARESCKTMFGSLIDWVYPKAA